MTAYPLKSTYSAGGSQILWEDGERVFFRRWRLGDDGSRIGVLVAMSAAEHPSRSSLDRLSHEYSLKDELDGAWAVRPLDLVHEGGRTMLVLEDGGGEPLDRLLGEPMQMEPFLRIAVAVAKALGKVHQRGLVHKDIKPANILVNGATGGVRLTGFGIASPLPRERQSPGPPETIAGTLAYMAPEQTGRMNRSIDSRSDLYAVGITFYQMLTGALPFAAAEPMEWVHCHLARCPVAPAERSREIPGAVSAIVIKLLAKWAEDRYQTAAGLENDLRRCQTKWAAQRRIDDFPLGERDTPDRLLIPEKLYGRQREVETLLASFDRVVKGSPPELVLVSGYSGIGKSSVVNELQPVLVPPRGLFASGKFDQFKRDIPYSTLAQAFQSLIRPLLGKSEVELAPWRDALREALGPNAELIVDLVPEVKLIIGKPPPIPELPPQDAQRRFQMVFRQFIGVFARPEHPLALFLDDLQWLDAATLDLLEDLLTRSELRHLMLIAAYRDNEVSAAHPLMRKLDAIKTAGGKVTGTELQPLAREHLSQLIADALRCEPKRSAPLAQLVHEKTGGNPFFAIQFISSLADEGMLAFDHDAARWSWDLDRIHAKRYTDNVVDLMVGKLNRLPVETQKGLRDLACLGNVAEIAVLSIALESPDEQVHASLWFAVRLELVERLEASYRFVHDRVQEAAYSLIPEKLRAPAHLRIGRLLAAHMAPGKREEAVFEVVNQLNRGAAVITSQDERDEVAELNLIAGRRAKGSTAYASALKYLPSGASLLGNDCWERRRDLVFALELERAECEFLTGELAAAHERLTALSSRTENTIERAAVAYLDIDVCMALNQRGHAAAVALGYLRRVGIEWSPHPTEDEARREYEQIWTQLGSRTIEDVAGLPLMSDPESLATVDVLTRFVPPAQLIDRNLACLTICRAVNLSLAHGNCDASCLAYLRLSSIAGPRFGDHQAGFRFGQVAYELVERRGLKRFQASTYNAFANWLVRWTKHVRCCLDLRHRAFEAANKIGDLTFAGYARVNLNSDLLFAGGPLNVAQGEAELSLAFVQKARLDLMTDVTTGQLALIRTLRGFTPKFGCFDSEHIDELTFEGHLAGNPALALAACWYWVRKLQARYFAGDYKEAMEASTTAQQLLWTSTAFYEEAEFHFYSALARSASCDSISPNERQQHLEPLALHQRQLEMWAENCPDNFENRAALVSAEIARIQGRDSDAMSLYERAIYSARTNGFVHNEALGFERASAFYRARGFNQFADLYLRNARGCYASWGADGKVRQLDQLHPDLEPERPMLRPTSTISAPVEGLDLSMVIQVSQAISGEIVSEKLLDIVMRKAMEHAGAERGLLIVPRRDELLIEAESKASGNDVIVRLGGASGAASVSPESIVRYVMRTHETVILDDASSRNPFSADPYILQCGIRSILCLPLINKATLNGILYLENSLTPHVFTPDRVTLLRVLASQAAISLENTRLYRDLEYREGKIRRLVDANILGIAIWNLEGAVVGANDAFMQMLQYDREDVVSGRLRRTDITPPEWRERSERAVAELRSTGTFQPFEEEVFRKDGSRVPILIGGALFEENGDEGVAFLLDLTERKRAEQALRRSEANLAEAQRLSHMGSWALSPAMTKILYWSEECYRIWGFDPAQGLPNRETVWRRIHPEDRERVLVEADEALRQKRDYTIDFRIVLPDGTVKHLEAIGHHRFSTDGELVQVIGTNIDVTERKRVEEGLRNSEYKLRQIIETVPSLIWSTDPAGEPIQLNQRIFDYSGLLFEDFKHGGWEAFIHPDDFPETIRAFSHAIQTGTSYETVHRLRRADGEFRWHHARGEPLRDEEGRIIQWYGLALDIDEAKKAEDRLRRSEAYLAEAQRLSHAGSWAYDPTARRLLYWSEENYRIWEFDTAHGLPDREVADGRIHPDDRDRVHDEAMEARRQKRDYTTEFRIALPDGTVKYVEGIVHHVFSAEGKLIELTGTNIDVTERKKAQDQLRRGESYLAQAQKLGHTGTCVFDATTMHYLYWSNECYRIWGLDPVQGLPSRETVWQRIHPDDRDRVWEGVEEALREKKDYEAEFKIVLPEGTVKYVASSMQHLCSADGEIVEVIVTHIDVTERKRAQKEHERLRQLESDLAHMNRLGIMGEQTASLVHEITQPIATARNNARAAMYFLDRRPRELGEVREALGCVVADADRAGEIIDRIRDQIKKAPPRKHHFDLNHAIDEVVLLGQNAITKNGVSVQTLFADGLFPVEGDRVQLQQVLLNLVLNAVEAMSSIEAGPRELLISTEQTEANGLLVAVRDSGPGIDPEHLERVFEAFYTTKASGVGMGLAICRTIIEAHGGRLWADANKPRGGWSRVLAPALQDDVAFYLSGHPLDPEEAARALSAPRRVKAVARVRQ